MAAALGETIAPAAPLVLPVVFESALCIVPPDDAWAAIQRARTEQKDAGLIRWPPHCNLLYPFVPNAHFGKLAPRLAAALAVLPPFEVTLARFASFDRPESSVLYLVPEVTAGPADSLHALHALLVGVAPYCGKSLPFVPHLTVTHTAGAVQSAAAKVALEAWWRPVTFTVDQVHCIARKGPTKPYELKWRVRLGALGGDADGAGAASGAEFVDQPYAGIPRDVDFAGEARRGLQERRRRGENRKQRGPNPRGEAPAEAAGAEGIVGIAGYDEPT